MENASIRFENTENRKVRFSIVTPSFNQLEWLRLCVASVRDQVEPEKNAPPFSIEHVVQDAGSRGIECFAKEVGATFYQNGRLIVSAPVRIPNYSLIVRSESDCGMYDAINRGLMNTSGEICCWLNSDEQYLEDALAKVATMFRKNSKLEILLGDALLVNSEFQPVCYRRIMVPGRLHTRLDHLHSLSCAMFFRRSVLPEPPLDPQWKVIGDAILMDGFLAQRREIVACGELLSVYAFTGKNLSADPTNNEHRLWLEKEKWPPSALRPLVVLYNRMRRIAHGAYQAFSVHVALFTLASPEKRSILKGIVSGKWPVRPPQSSQKRILVDETGN